MLAVLSPAIGRAQENRNKLNLLLAPSSTSARVKLNTSCLLSNDKPLKSTLVDIYRRFQVPFWIDRRVDIMQQAVVPQPENSQTLGQELVRLASSCGLQGGFVENIYVMAPANRLPRIQRSAVVLHGQLASKFKSIADSSKVFEWPDITSSNELLQIVSNEWDVEISNSELPHDLYHFGELPKCTLATQLALLLSGFDLQAILDPSSTSRPKLKIEPLATSSAWEDTYQRSVSETTLNDLRKRYPNSTLEVVSKDWIKVKGETNLHNDLLLPPPAKRQEGKPKEIRLDLDLPIQIPVEAVVKRLSQDLKFEVVWSPECTPKHRSTLVQVALKSATRSDLLKAVADAANLNFTDEGNRLLIKPK